MPQVTVATLNLFNRMGEWERRQPLVIDQLQQLKPDVIGFQEIDLMLDQGMVISREINKRLEEPHYRIKHAASPGHWASVFGIATLARVECIEHQILDLMSFERMAQRMVYQVEGRDFVFVNTHLHFPPDAPNERAAEAESILAWLKADTRGLPTIVAGDFNAYTGEPTVALMKSHFRSAYEAAHGQEPEKTWPTPVNTFDNSPPGTLDYIYVSPEFRVVDAGLAFDIPAANDPDLYPSDHLGLYARLEF